MDFYIIYFTSGGNGDAYKDTIGVSVQLKEIPQSSDKSGNPQENKYAKSAPTLKVSRSYTADNPEIAYIQGIWLCTSFKNNPGHNTAVPEGR